jgi:hypothetical protein
VNPTYVPTVDSSELLHSVRGDDAAVLGDLRKVTDIMTEMRDLSAECQPTSWTTTGGKWRKLLFARADWGPLQTLVQLVHAVKPSEPYLNLVLKKN